MMISLFDGEQILSAYTKEKLAEGRAEGEKRKAFETAKKMLMKAMPVDLVSELSGLSRTKIDALKAPLTQ